MPFPVSVHVELRLDSPRPEYIQGDLAALAAALRTEGAAVTRTEAGLAFQLRLFDRPFRWLSHPLDFVGSGRLRVHREADQASLRGPVLLPASHLAASLGGGLLVSVLTSWWLGVALAGAGLGLGYLLGPSTFEDWAGHVLREAPASGHRAAVAP